MRLAAVLLVAGSSCRSPDAPPPPGVTRRAELDGVGVSYLDAGSAADAIVLVHGWSCDRRVWSPLVPGLAESHRVLAVDLPGHGASDEPVGPYGMDLFARGIAAVLDHAGVARAVLVGHSNGVPAVRQFYRRHPDRTRGLVLVDGPLRSMIDEASGRAYLERLDDPAYREQVLAFIDSMPTFDLDADRLAAIRAMAGEQSRRAVVGGLAAALDPEIWTADTIGCPVLVLNAEQPAWDADYVAFVRRIAPEVDYRVLPGVSHFLMLDRPEEFNARVLEFAGRLPR
jgi:pimeloyl-ACP methyl ester carboxylesterase